MVNIMRTLNKHLKRFVVNENGESIYDNFYAAYKENGVEVIDNFRSSLLKERQVTYYDILVLEIIHYHNSVLFKEILNRINSKIILGQVVIKNERIIKSDLNYSLIEEFDNVLRDENRLKMYFKIFNMFKHKSKLEMKKSNNVSTRLFLDIKELTYINSYFKNALLKVTKTQYGDKICFTYNFYKTCVDILSKDSSIYIPVLNYLFNDYNQVHNGSMHSFTMTFDGTLLSSDFLSVIINMPESFKFRDNEFFNKEMLLKRLAKNGILFFNGYVKEENGIKKLFYDHLTYKLIEKYLNNNSSFGSLGRSVYSIEHIISFVEKSPYIIDKASMKNILKLVVSTSKCRFKKNQLIFKGTALYTNTSIGKVCDFNKVFEDFEKEAKKMKIKGEYDEFFN